MPDFDLFVGGFPCQPFSVAGKRRGFEDTRGTLFYHIARIIKAKRPSSFLLENVPGLLSHGEGETYKTILETFSELGYCLDMVKRIKMRVHNSADHQIPQSRKRVFIVGYLDFGMRKINFVYLKNISSRKRRRQESSETYRRIAGTAGLLHRRSSSDPMRGFGRLGRQNGAVFHRYEPRSQAYRKRPLHNRPSGFGDIQSQGRTFGSSGGRTESCDKSAKGKNASERQTGERTQRADVHADSSGQTRSDPQGQSQKAYAHRVLAASGLYRRAVRQGSGSRNIRGTALQNGGKCSFRTRCGCRREENSGGDL